MPARRRTLAAVGLLVAAGTTGCGVSSPSAAPSPVTPGLSAHDAAACSRFMHALPKRLADQPLASRSAGGRRASYGDPAIVVTCGVGVPPGFKIGAECQVANGVGWYLPSAQYDDQSLDATLTAAGYRPRVEAVIPAVYRPNALPAVMAELAGGVRRDFRKTTGCV
ncbi:MAG: DUF3515 domain-containing protein [Nocardioidaceae bacterium]|nr:DUF3515 domain-containing protein [Nocardioidaceae bacterium]MCL2612352.1 DUF3515 domain-containing protein [Nocardioidaceae bacterium]